MRSLSPRELLLRRGAAKSIRGSRSDGCHLALVLEGGGMRGVVSVAMASVIEERGLFLAFDSVHGSSAGACNAAYFAAEQAEFGGRIYYEDINNKKFIDTRRILLGRPIMNKDFLIDNVMHHGKPLDTRSILDKRGFLHIVVTEARTGKERVFSAFKDETHLFEALRATICIPIIAGRAVHIDGVSYLDGGLVQQVALKSALDAGATHVIVLMTRRENELERRNVKSTKYEAGVLKLIYGNPIASLYRERGEKINRIIKTISAGRTDCGARIEYIARPEGAVEIDRLTTNAEVIGEARHDSRYAATKYLDGHSQ